MTSTIWYDGAARNRDEVIERVERDAIAFVATRVADFAADHTAWMLLVHELGVRIEFDRPNHYPTASMSPRIAGVGDELVVELSSELFSKSLESLHAAMLRAPWCLEAKLGPNRILLSVALDPVRCEHIELAIRTRSSELTAAIHRGIDAFLAVIRPDESPRVQAAVDDALHELKQIEAKKLAVVRASQTRR